MEEEKRSYACFNEGDGFPLDSPVITGLNIILFLSIHYQLSHHI